jgi:hypothetical protein
MRTRREICGWAIALAVACIALAGAASARAADSVLFAAGDIACDPLDPNFNGGSGTATACRAQATVNLMPAGSFDAVLALGDLQYDAGNLLNFQQSYDLSWGRVKSQTLPVIGNHEGTTAALGAGYCVYFGAAAHCNSSRRQGGAAFYSFNLGDWHGVVLNSNCDAAGGCGVGSPQYRWLANDLASNPRECTVAAWHHPRWSSGAYGSSAFMQPIWQLLYANGADLVLSGHSHDYERFAPIDGAGAVNPSYGMRQFVVGTGGVYFTGLGNGRAPGSEVAQNTSFGVLRLVLHPTSYDWRFLSASGSLFTDSGTQSCHGGPAAASPPPPVESTHGTPASNLLARWRLKPRFARRALARGWVRIPRRRWAPTIIHVRVGGRVAAKRRVRTRRAVRVRLAAWTAKPRYRRRTITVTVLRPG